MSTYMDVVASGAILAYGLLVLYAGAHLSRQTEPAARSVLRVEDAWVFFGTLLSAAIYLGVLVLEGEKLQAAPWAFAFFVIGLFGWLAVRIVMGANDRLLAALRGQSAVPRAFPLLIVLWLATVSVLAVWIMKALIGQS